MINPTNGNLIVKVEKLDEVVSSSGIIVTDKEMVVERAEVIAAPVGSQYDSGTKVYYKDYSLSTIKIGDEEYNFLPETDVLAYE
jgi:co-chaperonin GroES (HSP10)